MRNHIRIIFSICFAFCYLLLGAVNNEKKLLSGSDEGGYGEGTMHCNADNASVSLGASEDLFILSNDSQKERVALRIDVTPEYGVAEVLPNNEVRYTSTGCTEGKDLFVYVVYNERQDSAKCIVNITLNNANTVPLATDDVFNYTTIDNHSLPILDNDSYCEEPIQVSLLEFPEFCDARIITNENGIDELLPQIAPDFIGECEFSYELCDASGDCDIAKVTLTVTMPPFDIKNLPKGFSPNGDNINDYYFIPDFVNREKVNFQVINEWGKLVFENADFGFLNNKRGWDGIANVGSLSGKDLPSGTYYFVFEVEEESKPITGFLYLSR